jgi:hypothetical protein
VSRLWGTAACHKDALRTMSSAFNRVREVETRVASLARAVRGLSQAQARIGRAEMPEMYGQGDRRYPPPADVKQDIR